MRKRLAVRVHKPAFQRGFGRERNGVQEQIQPAEFRADFAEHMGDVFILCHIARHNQRVRAERAGEFLDVFLHAVALVGEREPGAFPGPRLGDGPRDGALVGDAEDNSRFSCKQ